MEAFFPVHIRKKFLETKIKRSDFYATDRTVAGYSPSAMSFIKNDGWEDWPFQLGPVIKREGILLGRPLFTNQINLIY